MANGDDNRPAPDFSGMTSDDESPPDLGLASGDMKGLNDLVSSMASARAPQLAPQQQQAPQVPRPGLPNIVQFIGGLINPSSPRFNPVGASTGSRAPVFENFIANTLYALGQGFANEGHGPGAAMRGAGAAATAPYQRDLQNFQLQQEANKNQAQIGQAQAQTGLTGAQTQEAQLNTLMLKRRLGMMESADPDDAIKGLGQLSSDEQAQVSAARTESLMKGDYSPLLKVVENVSNQRAISGRSGPSAVIQDADSKTGWAKVIYDKAGKDILQVIRDVPPAAGAGKTTVSQHVVEGADGKFHVYSLTSRTAPNVPQGGGQLPGSLGTPGAAAPPAAQSSGGQLPGSLKKPTGGGTPKDRTLPFAGKSSTQMMVGTDATGKQIAGTPGEMQTAGVSSFTKLDASEAAKVNTARQLTSPGGLFSLADQDLARFKPGELEGLGPRWNEFLAGKVGTADPRYVALRTHVNGLLATAMMQAHVGAKGGNDMMHHFEDIANAGKMSLPTLKAALDAERQYVEEKAMRPQKGYAPPTGAPSATGPNGHKIVFDSGKWVDAASGQPI